MMCWHRSRSTSHTAQRCKTANVSMQEQAKFPNLNVQRNHSVSCSKTQSLKRMQQEGIAPSVTPRDSMYNAHSVQYSDRQRRSPTVKVQKASAAQVCIQAQKKTPEGVLHICMCPARARLPILPQPSAAVLSATTGLTTEFGTGSGDPRLYCRARARRKHMAGLKTAQARF